MVGHKPPRLHVFTQEQRTPLEYIPSEDNQTLTSRHTMEEVLTDFDRDKKQLAKDGIAFERGSSRQEGGKPQSLPLDLMTQLSLRHRSSDSPPRQRVKDVHLPNALAGLNISDRHHHKPPPTHYPANREVSLLTAAIKASSEQTSIPIEPTAQEKLGYESNEISRPPKRNRTSPDKAKKRAKK